MLSSDQVLARLCRRVVELEQVDALGRHAAQRRHVGPAALPVPEVEHEPEVLPVCLLEQAYGAPDVRHAREGQELEADRQPAFGGEVAERREPSGRRQPRLDRGRDHVGGTRPRGHVEDVPVLLRVRPLEQHLGRRDRQPALAVVVEVLLRRHVVGDRPVVVGGPDGDAVESGVRRRVDERAHLCPADRLAVRDERCRGKDHGREYRSAFPSRSPS